MVDNHFVLTKIKVMYHNAVSSDVTCEVQIYSVMISVWYSLSQCTKMNVMCI